MISEYNSICLHIIEVEGVFFQDKNKSHQIENLDYSINNVRDLLDLLNRIKCKKLVIDLSSDIQLEKTRAFTYFNTYIKEVQLEFHHENLSKDQTLYHYDLTKKMKLNSMISYLSFNYDMDELQFKHVILDDVHIDWSKSPIFYELPFNSVCISKGKVTNYNCPFLMMYDRGEYIYHGKETYIMSSLRKRSLMEGELLDTLNKLKVNKQIQIEPQKYDYIEDVKASLGICSLNLIKISNKNIYTRYLDDWVKIGDINSNIHVLQMNMTNKINYTNKKYWKIIDTIYYYQSKLGISESFTVENILFTEYFSKVQYESLWNIMVFNLQNYSYFIDIIKMKVIRIKSPNISLYSVLNSVNIKKDFLKEIRKYITY